MIFDFEVPSVTLFGQFQLNWQISENIIIRTNNPETQYTLVSGFSKNVFPVFAGPQIITFQNLLRPFSRTSFIALVKVSFQIPFCCNTSPAQASHCPLQPSTHLPCAVSPKI